MPHQALQDLQRYTGIQHVHRIGMAERMWRDRNRECHTISGSGGNRFPNPGPDRSVRHFPDPRFLCPACSFITPFHGDFQCGHHRLQLAVELTDAGRTVAQPLLQAEQEHLRAEQRAAEVVVLPLIPLSDPPADGTSAKDLPVELDGITYQACRGDFVVRLDGSTCLQLWNKEGRVVRREGDPLEVAQWLQTCHDAGIEVRVQVNESVTP